MGNVKTQKFIKDLSPTDRPRERFKNMGVEGLSTVELIALILGSGSSHGSVLKIASQLHKKFPLSSLSKISTNQLTSIPGIGPITAGKLQASIELGRRSLQPTPLAKINTPQAVLQAVNHIRHKKREYAVALYLNGRQELIHKQTISIGGVNFNYLEARDIFGPAMNLPSPYVVLAHNHPSGDVEASNSDHEVTHRLLEAGKLLGIQLTDHLVVSHNNYFSFREAGVILNP